ncbi:MAG: hypothetical protein QM776_02820 [Rhodocyclaceae bacterium]
MKAGSKEPAFFFSEIHLFSRPDNNRLDCTTAAYCQHDTVVHNAACATQVKRPACAGLDDYLRLQKDAA